MTRKTAIVTGCNGFLGSYLARELSGHGWDVHGVDRNTVRHGGLDAAGKVRFHCLNLPAEDFQGLLTCVGPEVIVHAAGPASVPNSLVNPVSDFEQATSSLLCILDAVRKAGVATRIVFLSSAAVYGNPSSLPVPETAALNPISPYGFHKLACEQLIDEYRTVFGLEGCSIRVFSAYGLGLRRQVLWDVSQRMLKESEICLLGKGNETRDFIHAFDVARGVRTVIESGGASSTVFNLASGCETNLAELAGLLANALEVTPRIRFSGSRRKGDPARWCADITRLTDLGYSPTVSLMDGVRDYARWVSQDARHSTLVHT